MLHVTDAEFIESKQAQEQVYGAEGQRPAGATRVDPLGHARWDTDYYTLRAAGYAHPTALQEMRCRIREAWVPPLPALEPHPPVPGPPPVVDQPGVKDDAERFCAFYLQRCRETGFKPDQPGDAGREAQVRFLSETLQRYGDPSITMKRADPTRPISNEAIVFARPGEQYRWFWDFIANAGSPGWVVQAAGPGEALPPPQVLVDPATLQIIPG